MKVAVIIIALVIVDIIIDTIVLGPARVRQILSLRFGRRCRRETPSEMETACEEDSDFYCDEDDF